ncbi:MAG: hypothetical protein M3P51_16175 [Chloroflexota bacterium]|nr:hypothetical protein [Chloroflexota bacterium]
MSDYAPETQPAGSLDPPNRRPPTAVGAAIPEPEPRPESAARERPGWNSLGLRGELTEMLRWTARRFARAAAEALRSHSRR